MIFMLSFAVFGASGVERPFPKASALFPLFGILEGVHAKISADSGRGIRVWAMWIIVTAMGLWTDWRVHGDSRNSSFGHLRAVTSLFEW